MTTLNISGRNVQVSDDFLKLSPNDQQATVDEIASSFAPAEPVTTNDAVRSAATGVPIVGGLLNKADAATDAGLSYALNPLFDDKDQLKGSLSDRYSQALDTQNAADAQFSTNHPMIDTALKTAGAIGGTLPAMAAAPAAFGLTGGLPGMIMRGAASNAALGGADALTRGGDPLVAAGVGGALGAAGPAVAAGARGVVSPFVSRLMAWLDPEGYGRRQVARGIIESGRSTGDIANDVTQAANEGQGVYNIADAMGNSGQRLLSTVARAPGEGRTAVVDALEGRQGTQGRRVTNTLSEGFNVPQTAAQTRDAMTAARDTAANAEYGAVRNDAQPVDVQNVLDHIDANVPTEPAAPDTISGRLQRYRRMLTNGDEENPQNLTDFEHVQRVRSELSDEIQSARQGGQGNRARLLKQVLAHLDNSLEDASQGFRQANRNFTQASRDIDAVQAGRQAATQGRTEDTIPAFQNLTQNGQQAFRAGYTDPLIAQTQGAAFGANKARPLLNDAFRDEAGAMAPGNDLMQRRIGREQTMFATRNQALGGSRTADNLADADAMGVDPSIIGHIAQHNYGAAVRSLIHAGSNAVTGNTPAVRSAVARILLRSGANVTPTELDQLVGQTVKRLQTVQRLARTGVRSATTAAAINSNANNTPIFAKRRAKR